MYICLKHCEGESSCNIFYSKAMGKKIPIPDRSNPSGPVFKRYSLLLLMVLWESWLLLNNCNLGLNLSLANDIVKFLFVIYSGSYIYSLKNLSLFQITIVYLFLLTFCLFDLSMDRLWTADWTGTGPVNPGPVRTTSHRPKIMTCLLSRGHRQSDPALLSADFIACVRTW
jgi:hypothetical protein